MKQIVKSRQLVTDDFHLVERGTAADALPPGNLFVPLELWLEAREQLQARPGRTGVWLDGDDDPTPLLESDDRPEPIAIRFPAFRDGRGYSLARKLRRAGYRGELRAVGDVLRDQIAFMERVGFDAFEIAERQDPAEALAAFDEISVKYQPSADEPLPIWRRRTG